SSPSVKLDLARLTSDQDSQMSCKFREALSGTRTLDPLLTMEVLYH
ncbi:MAG: hypothetical protein QOC86_2141, partial [Gaiellales bacterium]|nr:hypothetical protein [Gaiellales bacterium]